MSLEQALDALIRSEAFERVLLERARPLVARADAGEDALVAALAAPVSALAREGTAPRATEPATRVREQPAPMDAVEATRQANAARLAQKAREGEWDRKTGQETRSICTGAKGC